MSGEKLKGPTRYQAKVWADTVLQSILSGEWFRFAWDTLLYHGTVANARQIGRYFPEFGEAFDLWMGDKNSFSQAELKKQAERVVMALPVPFDHPDIYYELDDSLEEVARVKELNSLLILEKENVQATRKTEQDVFSEQIRTWKKRCETLERENKKLHENKVHGEENNLKLEIERLKKLVVRSIRIEEDEFEDGESGCRFILGEEHVVAEWRGDGIATDTVFAEDPSLEYGVTTTPLTRCFRMAFEMVHWPLLCAIVDGPGNGQLGQVEQLDYERKAIVDFLRCYEKPPPSPEYDEDGWINPVVDAIERGDFVE